MKRVLVHLQLHLCLAGLIPNMHLIKHILARVPMTLTSTKLCYSVLQLLCMCDYARSFCREAWWRVTLRPTRLVGSLFVTRLKAVQSVLSCEEIMCVDMHSEGLRKTTAGTKKHSATLQVYFSGCLSWLLHYCRAMSVSFYLILVLLQIDAKFWQGREAWHGEIGLHLCEDIISQRNDSLWRRFAALAANRHDTGEKKKVFPRERVGCKQGTIQKMLAS